MERKGVDGSGGAGAGSSQRGRTRGRLWVPRCEGTAALPAPAASPPQTRGTASGPTPAAKPALRPCRHSLPRNVSPPKLSSHPPPPRKKRPPSAALSPVPVSLRVARTPPPPPALTSPPGCLPQLSLLPRGARGGGGCHGSRDPLAHRGGESDPDGEGRRIAAYPSPPLPAPAAGRRAHERRGPPPQRPAPKPLRRPR